MTMSDASPFEQFDEEKRSEEQIKMIGPELARQAAAALREDPDADFVGIIAEAGTLESKRCRTKLEQGTGVEFAPQAFAGVLTVDDLTEILDRRFPPQILEWLLAGERGSELRYVVCTKNGFRVAAVPLPGAGT